MMETFEFAGVSTDISLDIMTPAMNFEMREQNFLKEQTSLSMYDDMTPEQRAATIARVKLALEVMYDNIERWLPASFDFNEVGQCLKIEYNLLVTDIECEVAENELATSKRIKAASQELKDLLKELEEDE